MKFFEQLASFFMMPVDQIMLWIQELEESLGLAWAEFWHSASIGITHFAIEGVMVVVISYLVYCALRVMLCNKDETFSEYINKSMVAGLAYFFAKAGGNIILSFIGG